MHRRQQLFLAALVSFAALVNPLTSAPASAQQVDVQAVLHDPDAPETGNPKGDVTIVAYTDYNCPFCKKSEPDLSRSHLRLR